MKAKQVLGADWAPSVVFSMVFAAGVLMTGLSVADNTAAPTSSSAPTPSALDETTETDEDPLESLNRVTSEFNRVVRGILIDPLVDGYQLVTPDPIEGAVSNIFSNLSEPVTAASSLLQGDIDNAKRATGRFMLNSTLGFGGATDAASDFGVEKREEDLGQAMGAQGVDGGAHIVLPILGPSNLRDVTGDLITGLISPLPLAAQAVQGSVEYSDNQDTIRGLGAGAVDPYIVEREAYEQNRVFEINNGAAVDGNFPVFVDDGPAPDVATSDR